MICSVFLQTTKHDTKQLRQPPVCSHISEECACSCRGLYLFPPLLWLLTLASKQANVATYHRNVNKSFVKKVLTLIRDSYYAIV